MRVIRGFVAVVAVLVAASCGREAPLPPDDPPSVELEDAVFVLNPDGTATLSAKVVNGTDSSLTMPGYPEASFGSDQEFLNVRSYDPGVRFPAVKSTTLGHEDEVLIRLAEAPPVGARVSLVLNLSPDEVAITEVAANVPVVERTIDHNSILGVEPSKLITIEDGKIFVIPGQKEALVDGSVVSSIRDMAYELPTANDEQGNLVKYRHHTATGGPYGIIAEKGKSVRISSPPYTVPEGENMGDFDYFDAKDLTIGEKITVNIPFQSGDVIATFTVVRG